MPESVEAVAIKYSLFFSSLLCAFFQFGTIPTPTMQSYLNSTWAFLLTSAVGLMFWRNAEFDYGSKKSLTTKIGIIIMMVALANVIYKQLL